MKGPDLVLGEMAHNEGLRQVGVYCLAIGVVQVIAGLLTLAAKNSRNTIARSPLVRAKERMVPVQFKLGRALAVTGLVLLLTSWFGSL